MLQLDTKFEKNSTVHFLMFSSYKGEMSKNTNIAKEDGHDTSTLSQLCGIHIK